MALLSILFLLLSLDKAVLSNPLSEKRTVYTITLNSYPPSAAFYGDSKLGLAPTAPAPGKKLLDSGIFHLDAYAKHLTALHDSVLSDLAISPSRKLYSYTHVLNAFSVALNEREVEAAMAHPAVGSVVKNGRCFPQTTHTPDFLHIPESLWERAGGKDRAGEGVIIGVIDTGITPDHPSFSDQVEPKYEDIHRIRRWRGNCHLADANFTCNKKLIGARFFVAGLLAEGDEIDLSRDLYSPRDFNGHGTHTASTAGGNNGVPVTGIEEGIEFGSISGMAPRARIAAYKGLWFSGRKYPGSDYGTVVDLLAALDTAVGDGVDVINYSIGPSDDFFDLWALGVLYASKAGVFVTASGGNSGPEPVTMSHVAPWYLAVAASTHDREYRRQLETGSGEIVTGQGLVSPPRSPNFSILKAGRQANLFRDGIEAPLVAGYQAAINTSYTWQAKFCIEGSLDPSKVRGTIVVCERGVTGRVAKGEAVYKAGGAGLVLWNDSPKEGLITDIHFLPSLHVIYEDGIRLLKYINTTTSPYARISGQLTVFGQDAPTIIDFSSRGPVQDPIAGEYPFANDILKPDVAAPGVSIWAGFAPAGDDRGFKFNLISGTSMASPHVAGIAALIRQAHPEWDPYWVKSALQTTAITVDSTEKPIPGSPASVPGTPFDYGSGQVNPPKVTDPGLVYPSDFEDYIQFLYYISFDKALKLSGVPPPLNVTRGRDLNTPNIAVSQLNGSATVVRRVISVAETETTFLARVEAPEGVQVEVDPEEIKLSPGESATYSLTFTAFKASKDFKFGTLTWRSDKHTVSSQIAIQPLVVS